MAKARKHGTKAVNGTCAIKQRRSRAAIQELRDQLYQIVQAQQPMACRQVFYQAVVRNLIAKSEGEYRKTICRLLLQMRREGQLPYKWIADSTRWMRKPKTYSSLAAMLEYQQQTFRRAAWDEQDCYVEMWVEKDALAGVLYDVTWEWDVPLMPARGFSSESFLYEAAENIKAIGKPAYIYYFGDHDPSGVLIDKAIERGLRRLAPEEEIKFERVAITVGQIDEYGLPTRPTKTTGNTHARRFKGDSVELDALDPDTLRQLARDCITRHIDQDAYKRMLNVERAERDTLAIMAANLGGAQ